MSELPEKWASCTFGDVTYIIGGGTPRSKDPTNFTDEGGVPWITPSDLSGYKEVYISRGARDLTEKGLGGSSAKIMPAGSVLFSSRAPIGYVAIAANEISTNQGFKSFVLPKELDSRFIYFYLCNIKSIAESVATGTTFKELSGSKAAKLPLLVAPLPEQKRIADKLDTLLARVDSCQSHLERVPQILKRFRQSVLAEATSGRLTEDWREEKGLELSEWEETTVDEIAEVFLGRQRSPKNHFGPYMRKYVRAANVTWDGWNFSDVKEMNFDPKDFERYRLQVGDILLNEGSGSAHEVGKPAVWNGEIENCCFQNTLICIRPYTASSQYLYYLFLYTAMAKIFVKDTRGVNIFHIGKTRLAKFGLSLPSLEEQDEIVRRVDRLLAFADRLETRWQTGQDLVEKLTPSLLAKAFRGELVEQDPNDEPASVLLERIRAQQ